VGKALGVQPAAHAREAKTTRSHKTGPHRSSLRRLQKHRLTGKTSGWLGCGCCTCCSPDAGPWCCPCHCGHIPTPSAARGGNGAGVCAASVAVRQRTSQQTVPGEGLGSLRSFNGPGKRTQVIPWRLLVTGEDLPPSRKSVRTAPRIKTFVNTHLRDRTTKAGESQRGLFPPSQP